MPTNFPSVLNTQNYACQSLISISKGKRCFRFETNIRQYAQFFYISFPSVGGIRFNSGHTGLFEPDSFFDISYNQTDENQLEIYPVNGQSIKVVLIWDEKSWRLDFYNDSNKVLYIDNTMVLYGYDADNIHRNVVLKGKVTEGERFFGLGERFNGVFQNGMRIPLWNVDCCHPPLTLSREPGRPKTQGYKNVPLLHSTAGYSLFFNSTYAGTADIACYEPSEYSLEFAGTIFDVFFWLGTTKSALHSYLKLTGFPILPPRWVFDYWAGGGIQVWYRNGRENCVDTFRECLEKYQELGTPISAIYAESHEAHHPDPAFYKVFAEFGTRPFAWTNSRIAKAEDSRIRLEQLQVKRKSDPTRNMPEDYIDFSHPRSKDVLTEHYTPLWELGLRGSMIDYADNVAEDSQFYNGMSGDEMHNYYSYLYAKMFHDTWSSWLGDDYFLFSRSGCAGSQHWSGQFAGDLYATFPGLRQAVTAGLSISTSGFSNWGSDIGGYFGSMPTPELYIRWLQFGAFSPLMRAHGMTVRDPWYYGDEAVAAFKKYYWLRHSLLDYIYSGACAAHLQGDTLIRLLAIEYPCDKRFHNVDDQYLFGNELMVCPVLEENADKRHVVFPEGTWTSLWRGEQVKGGGKNTVPAPIDEIPVYIRAGAVLPVRVSKQYELDADMNNGNVIHALLITPADNQRTVTVYRDAQTKIVFNVTPSTDGMVISADVPVEENTILLYGIPSAEAVVDGKVTATEIKENGTLKRTILSFEGKWQHIKLRFKP